MIAPARLRPHSGRLRLTRLTSEVSGSTMLRDVVAGFTTSPKSLPPKYFYDEYGARLFDAICDTPEYYPTRTEQALLEEVAEAIVDEAEPTHLVELGSGAARKTRVLLDAMMRRKESAVYMPVDISEEMLLSSGRALLEDYPGLSLHGVVADYDHHLHLLPREGRRLIAFLGSTLGNFRQPDAVRFVRSIASGMGAEDRLLIGLDLVKPAAVLNAAYNDAAGITAEFNRNVLRVMNRELGADFDVERFQHVARYLPEQQQIEMYLEAIGGHTVTLRSAGRSFHIADGERIRTEISRKFDRQRAEAIASAAGLEAVGWYEPANRYFGLLVARVV